MLLNFNPTDGKTFSYLSLFALKTIITIICSNVLVLSAMIIIRLARNKLILTNCNEKYFTPAWKLEVTNIVIDIYPW